MIPQWKLYHDGSFDLFSSNISIEGCYPAIDGTPVRPVALGVVPTSEGGTIKYTLEQGELILTFGQDADSVTLTTMLVGRRQLPHYVTPLGNGRVKGANRFFRQGMSSGGPSGFEQLPSSDSLESYTVSAFLGEKDSTLIICAHDHSRFLQRCRVTKNKIPDCDADFEATFITESIPFDGDSVELPSLHIQIASDTWTGLRQSAAAIAEAMSSRASQPTSYHWCSWYYHYQHIAEHKLNDLLRGLEKISPKVPLQTIQIDAGYFPAIGDWLCDWHRFPSGLRSALSKIQEAGYRAGIWVAPLMAGNHSRLATEHPEWLLRNPDGSLFIAWHSYDGIWGYGDDKIYQLDTSHPGAMDYLRQVFRTLRAWGAEFFKIDMISWGFLDSTKVLRHVPGKTSVEYLRDMMRVIREEVGDESFVLGCGGPLAPLVGHVDSMRIAADLGPGWQCYHTPKNMVQETYALQYFNNIWWQSDPDIIFVRDFDIELSASEIRSLALWQAILGGSVNTSDLLHKVAPERLELWRFLEPCRTAVTATLPHYGQNMSLYVAVRKLIEAPGLAVFVFNPGEHRSAEELLIADLGLEEEMFVFEWSPGRVRLLGKRSSLTVALDAHQGALYYLSAKDVLPSPKLTLSGQLA